MTFTPDPQGIDTLLKDAQPFLHELATDIVRDARQGPRNPRHRKHEVDDIAVGEFRATDTGVEQDIDWPNPFWHLVEYGSANNPPYRPLTRAAQNHGLKITDRGRH